MPRTRNTSGGCWTCKARRKKCDQKNPELPTCRNCAVLQVACHYGQRPVWMDGGRQQQRMVEELKKDIKLNAAVRRRKPADGSTRGGLVDDDPGEANRARPLTQGDGAIMMDSLESVRGPTTPATASARLHHLTTSPEQSNDSQASWTNTETCAWGQTTTPIAEEQNLESGLLMAYLDYAFPVLFPFYRPSVMEGGRSWLLSLTLRFPTYYHNIIGLAACFFSALPVATGFEDDACVISYQAVLHQQMQKAVNGVQSTLKAVTQNGVHHSLDETVRLLSNIVQLVNFEVVFGSSDNWQMHLHAALDLFNQTIAHHGRDCQESSALSAMLARLRGTMPSSSAVWAPEQAALRFFTALLVYQEIIGCTVNESKPTLVLYYDGILSKTSGSDRSSLLYLDEFIGCQNWILRAIAEISGLSEWKKRAKRDGFLDILDLIERATPIQEELQAGMKRLEDTALSPTTSATPHSSYDHLERILALSNVNVGSTSPQPDKQFAVSKIWAHAAQVYLITVLSGWQPRNSQLRFHVAQAIRLLSTIDNPSWLRAVAWPLCVTGCLAAKEQESAFRDVINASSGPLMFCTLRNALSIMEKVWSMRNSVDADTWDVAFCLQILGYKVLLV